MPRWAAASATISAPSRPAAVLNAESFMTRSTADALGPRGLPGIRPARVGENGPHVVHLRWMGLPVEVEAGARENQDKLGSLELIEDASQWRQTMFHTSPVHRWQAAAEEGDEG